MSKCFLVISSAPLLAFLATEVLPVAVHRLNVAMVGDTVYYIEPQDDTIILGRKINRRS